MIKEIIEFLRMEFMMAKYLRLRLKIAKHVHSMANYAVAHDFQTKEAREMLRKMYEICEKESKE